MMTIVYFTASEIKLASDAKYEQEGEEIGDDIQRKQ